MRLMTVSEAAELLRLRPARVYQLGRAGVLPVVHLGRQVRVDEQALRDWIARGGQALSGGWRRSPTQNTGR